MEPGNRPPMLAHHLSLPNTSAEMNAIEKILQFSDSVPCKLRAKRGCATHPRSIAERVSQDIEQVVIFSNSLNRWLYLFYL